MSIPCNITPLGTHDGLPSGYTPLEFLQSAGAQYIDTQTYNVFEYELDYLSTYSGGSNILAGYIQPGSVRAFGIVEKNKVAIASTGDYYREADVSAAVKNTVVYNKNLGASVLINGVKYGTSAYGGKVLLTSPMTAELSVYLFACNAGEQGAHNPTISARLYGANLKNKELTILFDGKPAVAPDGTPCMFDTVTRKAFKNDGSGAFIAGVATVTQLTTLLHRLPVTGGKLTLSLPYGWEQNEITNSSLNSALAKGWTLIVQTYQEQNNTVSTYNLRRNPEIVWCRKAACDIGIYEDENGKRWQIEWCSAIFSPMGNAPEHHGYVAFHSIAEAAEAWQLHPYVAPESVK